MIASHPEAEPKSERPTSARMPSMASTPSPFTTAKTRAVPISSARSTTRPSESRRGTAGRTGAVTSRPDVLRLRPALAQRRRGVVLAHHVITRVALHRPESRVPDELEQVLTVHRVRRAVGVGVVGDLVL